MKNEALESLGDYAGEYKKTLRHGICYIQNEVNAIWYYKKESIWIIGPFKNIGSGIGSIRSTKSALDGRTEWLYRIRIERNIWKLAKSNDIDITFIMAGM